MKDKVKELRLFPTRRPTHWPKKVERSCKKIKRNQLIFNASEHTLYTSSNEAKLMEI